VQRPMITAVSVSAQTARSFPHWPPGLESRKSAAGRPKQRQVGAFHAARMGSYMDSRINLEWIQQVFDPLIRARTNGRPRVLVSDGFGTHESLEVMTHCFEQNITLCRFLKSHVVGRGKTMTYEDIVAVRNQRVEREAVKRDKQSSKVQRKRANATRCEMTSPLSKNVQAAETEIQSMDLERYCVVLRL
jgi:hypothetical protein